MIWVLAGWCGAGFVLCLWNLRKNSIPLTIRLASALVLSPVWIGCAAAEIAQAVGNWIQFRWEVWRHGRDVYSITNDEFSALRKEIEEELDQERKGRDPNSIDEADRERINNDIRRSRRHSDEPDRDQED